MAIVLLYVIANTSVEGTCRTNGIFVMELPT